MSPFTNCYENQIKAYNTCNSQALYVRAQVEQNQTAYVGIKALAMHLLVFNWLKFLEIQNVGNHFKLLAKVRAQEKKNYFHKRDNETME